MTSWKTAIETILGCAFLLGTLNSVRSDDDYGPDPPPDSLTQQQVWSGPNNQFVTSTVENADGWWWGTDNDGIWHFAPNAKPGLRWSHFRAEDGMYDDSITALCVDRVGRVWAGTERRGVCVYNNSGWQNFGIMSGPLGVHVTAISLNPVNGDIWICSEGGISIYSDRTKKWSYITEADGLPTDDLTCIAFTARGSAVVGTADDGLLLSDSRSNYHTWTTVTAPPTAQTTETGAGLSCNQINCLLIDKAGKIFCGTSSGLSCSTDGGVTWSYLHGWKWQIKARRYVRNSIQVAADTPTLPLSDDYVSALAFDKSGLLYIGHRQGGLEVLSDSNAMQLYHTRLNEYGIDIRTLTPLSSGAMLVGNYGEGASAFTWTTAKIIPESPPIAVDKPSLFPLPAGGLTTAQLSALRARIVSLSTAQTGQSGYSLGEDWQSQGDWLGRYGSEYAVLCAANGNEDQVFGDQTSFSVTPQIGIALNGTSVPSHWLQWEQSGDPRVLYDPFVNARRQSQWDDQGEQDDPLTEGPDLWLTVQVPAGAHRLSLYFVNNEGHTRTTRYRDYLVQLMSASPGVDFHQTYDTPAALPIDASTRMENLWPGVYDRFAVTGPATYYVKIDRNYSLNTIVQGVFIDPLGKQKVPATPWMSGFSLSPTVPAKIKTNDVKDRQTVVGLWSLLDSLYGKPYTAPLQKTARIQILRTAAALGEPESLLTEWRIQLGLWDDNDWSTYNAAESKLKLLNQSGPK